MRSNNGMQRTALRTAADAERWQQIEMDTDDLTALAYETISRAGEVLDVLRAEIGASAREYRTEDEFLNGTMRWLDEILDDPREYLDSRNYLDTIDETRFVSGVRDLKSHIQKTMTTPLTERGDAAFEE